MFSYIDELRKKPVKERREAARTITVMLVLFIGGLWVLSRLVSFSDISVPNSSATEEKGGGSETGIVGPYE